MAGRRTTTVLVAMATVLASGAAPATAAPTPVPGTSLVEAGPGEAVFEDVGSGHRFHHEIATAVEAGLTTGYDDGTFRPAAPVTRQAAATFLWRHAGEPSGPFPSHRFTDVEPTHTFGEAIRWSAHEGITTGYDDGTFRPTAPVTRQAWMAFQWRAAGEPEPTCDDTPFPDVGPTHRFHEPITWAACEDITGGYDDGTFRPTAIVTRQAAVAFLVRPLLRDPPPSEPVYAQSWSAVHADSRNSDHSPVEVAPDVAPRWSLRIEGDIQIGPLPWTINLGPTSDPDGNLYVTSSEAGCHLRALDGATGGLRWCAEAMDLFAVVSSPAIDRDGHLYLADGRGLHSLTRDGVVRWSTPLEGVPLSVQFTPDGHLVFVTHTGTAYVVDRTTGEVLVEPLDLAPGVGWSGGGLFACARGTEDCPAANTPAVDPDTGVVYFTLWSPGAAQAGLQALRYEGGEDPSLEPLWRNDSFPGGTASSPTLSADGTRLYVTDNVDALHAVDAATGETVWTHTLGYAAGGSVSLSPDGLILPAGGGQSPLQAVRDEGDRAVEVWRHDDLLNRGIPTQTAGDRVYATVDAGPLRNDLVVLDATDGTILDREPLPGTSVFSVGTTVGNDGTVYVPTIVGGLHAFR
jgi:outer membrane protein assembly factor BamB